MNLRNLISLFVALLPLASFASTRWTGDFETGNLSQYSSQQIVANDRMQIVTSPIRQGRYGVKVTVRQGDNPINASGNRNELVYMSNEATNSEYFYKWSTMFDTTFPCPDTWQLFAQWHHTGSSGSPPIEFIARKEKIMLRVGGDNGIVVWTAPIARTMWHDFVLHVKWSPNKSVGFVELYHRGALVVPKTYVATQYAGQGNYMKLGLYRNSTIAQNGIVFHDSMRMATTLADVLQTVGGYEGPSGDTAGNDGVTEIDPTLDVIDPETGYADDGADHGPEILNGEVMGCASTAGGPLTPVMALALPLAALLLAARRRTPSPVVATANQSLLRRGRDQRA